MNNEKKKIIVIAPILPQWSDIKFISMTLGFLMPRFNLIYIDPLAVDLDNMTFYDFTHFWVENIQNLATDCHAIFGFSLGGVLLQSAFEANKFKNKKIVLFSTPVYADKALFVRLSEIILLLENNLANEAINLLNKYVSYPNHIRDEPQVENERQTVKRLCFGFKYILSANNTHNITKAESKYIHFIGDQSKLVSDKSIVVNDACKLFTVPQAGMRVLSDNIDFCIKPILQYLEG